MPMPGWVLLRLLQRETAGMGLNLLPPRFGTATHPKPGTSALNDYGGVHLAGRVILTSAKGQQGTRGGCKPSALYSHLCTHTSA